MTASRDPERLIRAFLDEGPTDLPRSTYDAVRSTSTEHVNGPLSARGTSNVEFRSDCSRAAAVLAVAVVGWLPSGQQRAGRHRPSPSPSPTATASPTATPQPTGPFS
jgi:hypothetical protein